MISPEPGLVVHHGYLWLRESRQGRVEGVKDRPVVVVDVDEESIPGDTFVTVAPITHSPPERFEDALEIPPETKRRLGLDEARSWVVVLELNRFAWPGFDLRRTPDGRDAYGTLPRRQTRDLIEVVVENHRRRSLESVDRD